MEIKNNHVEKLPVKVREAVNVTVKKLHNEGYVFDFHETSDEYLIVMNGKEYHFTKLDKIPNSLDGKSSVAINEAIEQEIRETLHK